MALTIELKLNVLLRTVFVVSSLSACGSGGQYETAIVWPLGRGQDDTASVQSAIDHGGIVKFAPGQFVLTQTIVVRKSDTVIEGAGSTTVFTFRPTLPQVTCVNDRAFTTPCDVVFSPRQAIVMPIAIGDDSFVAAGDTSDLARGDWVIVSERDRMFGNIVACDWAQVASTSGTTVRVSEPFRTAFSSAQPFDSDISGLGFRKLPQLVEGVEYRNLKIVVPDSGAGTPAISVFAAKDTFIDGVNAYTANGQALYSFLSKGLVIRDSSGSSGTVLSEFAATVDLDLSNNIFSADQGPGFGLDLGAAFFSVTGNDVSASRDIGVYLFIGIHDGIVESNQISFVPSSGNAIGILARGTQNVRIINNYLAGGEGAASEGISIGADYNEAVPIPSLGNVVAPNVFGPSWGVDYDPSNHP